MELENLRRRTRRLDCGIIRPGQTLAPCPLKKELHNKYESGFTMNKIISASLMILALASPAQAASGPIACFTAARAWLGDIRQAADLCQGGGGPETVVCAKRARMAASGDTDTAIRLCRRNGVVTLHNPTAAESATETGIVSYTAVSPLRTAGQRGTI
jgi:hypothetical protein